MITNKPFHFFIAIFIALGLFLSPFSMKHSSSASKPNESSASHCMGSDSLKVEETSKKIPDHHKTGKENKKIGSCCVAACAAIVLPSHDIYIGNALVKSSLVVSSTPALSGNKGDGLVRPPKTLV